MITAFSYSYNTLPKEVTFFQKKVFDFFNLPLQQITGNFDHGQFLEYTLKTCKQEYVLFFDADCIPLIKNFYDIVLTELKKEKCIIGIEQTGQPRYHIYAGPGCLGLAASLYTEFNYPCLNQTYRSDIAEELTWLCEEKAIPVKTFKVCHIEQPKWRLGYDREFGIGTTYAYNGIPVLYHQFEIRHNTDAFIKKCKHILNEQ